MNVYVAAEQLQRELERFDWLTGVAAGARNGQEVIFVYTNRAVRASEITLVKGGWNGFPVIIERTGRVYPARL